MLGCDAGVLIMVIAHARTDGEPSFSSQSGSAAVAESRVPRLAPLTLAALGPELGRALLDEFIFVESSAQSSFPTGVDQVLRFLEFVIARGPDVPHVAEVATFERAMLIASEAVGQSAPARPAPELPCTVRRNPVADVVA